MNRVSSIILSLEFTDVPLPVEVNNKEEKIVPLKPISDVFGLEWPGQLIKVNRDEWVKRLGTCVHKVNVDQGRLMTCIRLDRVAAYLHGINSLKVRIHGNAAGADFLEKKQERWGSLMAEAIIP